MKRRRRLPLAPAPPVPTEEETERALHIWNDFVENLVASGELNPSAPDYQERATAISELHQQDAHFLSKKFARERQQREAAEATEVLGAVQEADELAAAIAAVDESAAADAVAAVAASMAG